MGDTTAKRERHLFRTLTTIFNACNFESGLFTTHGYSGGRRVKERYALPGEMTLVKFLMTALAKRKKINKEENLRIEQQFNNEALKLADELKIKSFGFDIQEQLFQEATVKYRTRFNLLSQFKETMNQLGSKGDTLHNLAGSYIVFAKRSSGIDNRGRLVLGSNELVSDWLPVVKDYTQEKALMNIRNAQTRQALEKKVKEVLGISQFYCTHEIENSYTYEALMNNILKECQSIKKEWPNTIKLKVTSLTLSPQAECSTGTIVAPISNATPALIVKFLEVNGKEISEQFKAFKETAEAIRQFFNLTSLTYQTAPDLNDDQLWDCFSRLSDGANALVPYLTGIRLHVAKDYGINDDANLISIKWDYLVD